MLVRTISCINNRYRCHFRGILGSPFNIMSHNDSIRIIRNHENGIFQRLTLTDTRNLRIGKADNTCSKAIGCCFKTKSGTC